MGSDITSGRYFANPAGGCYWERQSGFGGSLDDVLANQFIGFDSPQEVVDVLDSDAAFQADGQCGDWFTTPRHGAQDRIPPGRWLVGEQIAPGTYEVDAADGCYWERLSHFEGTLDGIVANDFVSGGGQRLVTIEGGDTGFYSDADCGTWQASSRRVESAAASASRQDVGHAREANRRQEGW